MPTDIDYEQVLSALFYDAKTGHIHRRTPSGKGVVGGPPAGHTAATGYVVLKIQGRRYFAHRVAWISYHGTWPAGEIDHINGDRSDNRIENLRDVGHSINAQNLHEIDKDTASGLLGAHAHKGGFRSSIRVGPIRHYLGTYPTAQEAHGAYLAAKRRLHPGNTL